MTVIIGPVGGTGSRIPTAVSGSPFVDLTALETWSSANASELFNNSSIYAVSVVGGITYEYAGPNQVYVADSWVSTSNLSDQQEAAVDSIINAPNDRLLLARNGVVAGSVAEQLPDNTIEAQNALRAGSTSPQDLQVGVAWAINSAGRNINFSDVPIDENFHPVWQRYEVGRNAIFARERYQTVVFDVQPVDTDELTNPEWSIVIPQLVNEEGQTATQTDVKFAAASVLTNLTVEISIDGTPYDSVFLPLVNTGDYTFSYQPASDLFIGDALSFKVTSPDGDVIMLGDNTIGPTGFPYVRQEVLLWRDVPVGLLSDNVPHYKNANSTEFTLFDGQTYAADGTAGSFTLVADVNANSFSVFDFAGNWNSGSRKISVVIGPDTYELTVRRRIYFFYRDEQNNWQWYFGTRREG